MTLKQQIAEIIDLDDDNGYVTYKQTADKILSFLITHIEGKKATSSMFDSEMDRADTWGFNRALDLIIKELGE